METVQQEKYHVLCFGAAVTILLLVGCAALQHLPRSKKERPYWNFSLIFSYQGKTLLQSKFFKIIAKLQH